MDIIPLIHFKNHKIFTKKNSEEISVKEFKEKYTNIEKIYILDHDGIIKDKPNLCSFPKLSVSYDLWIDSTPKTIGDIVHLFTAGANSIIIRKNIWEKNKISEIKELTENKVFIEVDMTSIDDFGEKTKLFNDIDGAIIFNRKEEIDSDFKYSMRLSDLCKKHSVYIYEEDKKNTNYWKNKGISGFLVDLGILKEFKDE